MSDKTTLNEAIKFAELFEASMADNKIAPGAIITGTVVDVVKGKRVTVNAGLKSDAIIPIEEFSGEEVAIGDEIEVSVESLENGFGEARLSRKNARRAKVWGKLMKMQEAQETVYGKIIDRVKGGFTVEVDTIRAFLPGSLVDVRPVRDTTHLEGKELEFKVIKLDQKRNNVVVSRRAVIESENSQEREELLANLVEGQEVKVNSMIDGEIIDGKVSRFFVYNMAVPASESEE